VEIVAVVIQVGVIVCIFLLVLSIIFCESRLLFSVVVGILIGIQMYLDGRPATINVLSCTYFLSVLLLYWEEVGLELKNTATKIRAMKSQMRQKQLL